MYPSVNRDALSFADIASHATPRLTFLPTVLVIVTCLGSAVSALVVAGDILPDIVKDLALIFHHTPRVEDSDGKVDSYLLNRPTWVTLPLVFVLPLCFLHSITPLHYVGIITCITVVYLIVLVFVLFLFPSAGACLLYPTSSSKTCAENVVAYPASASSLVHSFLLACPIFFVSFSIIYQVLPVHNALRYPSLTTTRRATAGALVFSGLTYLLVSVSAYLTFGDRVQGNLFKNYGNTGALAVSRVMMLAAVALRYPLVIFAARASLLSLIPSASLFASHHFVSATVVLVVVSYLLALRFTDLNVIQGTVGALAMVPVCLTLPSLYFLRLSSLSPTLSSLPAEEEGKTRRWRVAARIGVGLGLVMTVLFMYGTYAT
ncbi:hypothetical protein NSK_000302 [Nannochloropsis salina CCMP1776]|uniref:Amino acid transporter transmembrane domain-containing protein n=1 Tax=Nannochloropsis salina CCMP1776 TaxID=1027361 RepID=A0A4D9DEX3_9STRA|nr:hypothetical protein NSK_000302 [Nannochloropsis salina CCMP1776]|eukprot:TFJ88733.1 hypothetical protein NSK_000302 [Nannochloropsis salina CCMP1776]